jgi:hypothetical protein
MESPLLGRRDAAIIPYMRLKNNGRLIRASTGKRRAGVLKSTGNSLDHDR